MISQGNHVKFARFVFLAVSEEAQTSFFFVSFNISTYICLRLQLITPTSTLIILLSELG